MILDEGPLSTPNVQLVPTIREGRRDSPRFVTMDLLEEITDHPICGDGAMGTLLIERGVPTQQCFEELCLSRPELIRQIHGEYLAAGARIIETNTFGANAVRLAPHGLENHVNEINWQAAQLARQVAKGAFVAGSIGPLGVSPANAIAQGIDREECFRTQLGALLDGGVDLLFLETFQDLDELLLALRVKHSLHHCPAICSLAPNEKGELPGGISLDHAFAKLLQSDAEILGINCVNGPHEALRLVEQFANLEAPLAAFPNAGLPRYDEGRYLYEVSPECFAEMGALMAARGVRIIGGCCGTNPSHIAALAARLSGKKTAPSPRDHV
jgi:methionine synthase I (cobalamin-dependent)